MAAANPRVGAYQRVDIETASQGKLIVMLFNGAIKRAEEAKRQLEKRHMPEVHRNLIRAQEILGELRGALNMKAGEIAQNLDRVYEYLQYLLVTANLRKEAEPIEQCIGFMVSIRDTWREVFDAVARDNPDAAPPPINAHGNAVLNLRG